MATVQRHSAPETSEWKKNAFIIQVKVKLIQKPEKKGFGAIASSRIVTVVRQCRQGKKVLAARLNRGIKEMAGQLVQMLPKRRMLGAAYLALLRQQRQNSWTSW